MLSGNMSPPVDAEPTQQAVNDKQSSLVHKLKKGTLNVFGYRNPSNPGNRSRKRAPSEPMANEAVQEVPSTDDQSVQVSLRVTSFQSISIMRKTD